MYRSAIVNLRKILVSASHIAGSNPFLWESPLVTGTIDAINTFDAQVTYRVPKIKTTFKLGGSNIFNNNYLQYAGGPTLGGLYYVAITADGLLTK